MKFLRCIFAEDTAVVKRNLKILTYLSLGMTMDPLDTCCSNSLKTLRNKKLLCSKSKKSESHRLVLQGFKASLSLMSLEADAGE